MLHPIFGPASLTYYTPTTPHNTPLSSTSTNDAAKVLYNGLRQGRDVVCPGIWNRFYVHVLVRILPNAAIGAIARVAWRPPPRWLPLIGRRSPRKAQPVAVRRRENYVPPDLDVPGEGLAVERRLRRWFHRFWYSPVIDYGAIKRWMAYPFRPKGLDIEVEDDNNSEGRSRRATSGGGEEEWDDDQKDSEDQDGADQMQREDGGEWDDGSNPNPNRGEDGGDKAEAEPPTDADAGGDESGMSGGGYEKTPDEDESIEANLNYK